MPELNGLKQVLDGVIAEEEREPGDGVAGSEDVKPDDASSEEQEFEEPSFSQVSENGNSERVESNDSYYIENGPSDERLTEDSGKEDMFVDCPEETEQSSEDNDDMTEVSVYELVNGTHNGVVIHSSKEESESLFEELSNLHHQLKSLSYQQLLNNENEEKIEIGKNLSIHDKANECSVLVKKALDEKLRMEEEFKKLHLSIIAKDQEIEYLHTKVSELSVSQNVVLSFFSSQNQSLSDSSNPSVEVQYGLQSVDDSINRLLASLATTVSAEGSSDESITGRMLFVEQNVSQLIGNYQYLLSEIELLRQTLSEVGSEQQDFWTTTAVARNVLLELKQKAVGFGQHMGNLEEENKKVNADVEKLTKELEQEKARYANTKEKLSMAVTKGKALVQQRDSLKQSLAEKTSEVEKCMAEIEEKSRALEATDLVREELARTENLVASLHETISQRDNILSKCEEILYQTSLNHELESADIMERIRSLVDEKNAMVGVMLEFNKLGDVLSSVNFPENLSSSDLESKVSWLLESFLLAKDEVGKLKDEITNSELAHEKIERLTVSLLAETQEKNFIQEELEGLKHKYLEIVEKESQLLMEKDHIVGLLLEASTMDGQEEAGQPGSDMGLFVDRCFNKIKERSRALCESSGLEADLFQWTQTQLYITNQELVLCKELLEEDEHIKAKMNSVIGELGTARKELEVLKDEKSALERDLERSDEKTSLLREKLSMAVKKGKGLVQDRENLKKLMDEKAAEIAKLNLTLQQQESMVDDFKNQISKLSIDLELIPKLEADLRAVQDQNDQLQQFLMESNNMVKIVMESIDGLVPPVDVTFEEPIGKVLWLVRYLNDCQGANTILEQELGNLKVDFDSLSRKLSDTYAAKSSLEEALSIAESNITRIGEENRELAESFAYRKSLEDALLEAENKISVLVNEKSSLEKELSTAESSISKLGEENRKIAEISATRKSLEDALLEAENKISVLVNEKSSLEEALSTAKSNISRLGEENRELAEIYACRKSLEDALLEAGNKISVLVNEKSSLEEALSIAKSSISKLGEEKREVAGIHANRKFVEDALLQAENKISVLINEKSVLEEALSTAESSISRLGEEKRELAEICADKKSFEDALIEAENKILVLINEKSSLEEALSTTESRILHLGEEKRELAETCALRKSLEDALLDAETKISVLINEKSSLQKSLSTAESSIFELGEEKRELAEICATRKSLEDELVEAQTKISVLINERNDAQLCKVSIETELEKVKEEVSTQTSRLAEAYRTINSLEDALSHLETNVSLLSKENNEAQVGRSNLEHEMKKLREEAEYQASKFVDATSIIRSLEDNISKLVGEKKKAEEEISILKEEAESQACKYLGITSIVRSQEDNLSKLLREKKNADEEMLILKKEAESWASTYSDLTSTIRSLEDNLSKLVGEKRNDEEEISMLKIEAEFQASKLSDATSTIRSLEDDLSKLAGEKRNSEEEVSLLNSKLTSKEELAGLRGNLGNRSLELSSRLHNLQLLLKDETLSALLRQSFEVKFQSLRDMDLLLREIKDHLVPVGSDLLPSSPGIEEDSLVCKFSAGFDNIANIGVDKGDDDSEGDDSFESYFKRMVEGIHCRNTILADKVQGSSTSMDKFFASLLKNFRETRDEVLRKLDQLSSLEKKVNDLETGREAQELKVARLENDVKVLFSACTVTAQELENKAGNYEGELSTIPELEKWSNLLVEVRGDTVTMHGHETSRCIKLVEDLLVAAQKVCALTRLLEGERNVSRDTIQVLENKLTEIKVTAENAIEERDLLQSWVSKLEIDLKKMQSSHQEMSSTLSDREAEISSLHKSLTMKEKEAEDALLVASQVKSLYDKINDLDIPFVELNIEYTEFHDSDHLKKLFYVVEAVSSMRQQMNTLTQDKGKLQSTVEKQTQQIKKLEEIGEQGRGKDDLEKMKNEMFDVELGMENIIHKLGGNILDENHKSAGMKELISVLEKLVTTIILEYDNTKSRAQELAVKLHGSQKSVDELSAKVKLLELSSQGRSSSSDAVEERSIFEAPPLPTHSEITELEDVELLGKKAVVGQAPSAPHARPLRKGSNDHLAINIDSESDRLIKNEENDEDKGKVFKSLTTSGLIPRQGKLFADRLDGYWVSGDRALMSRPRARLGLIAYWLLLHIWLLGTIL